MEYQPPLTDNERAFFGEVGPRLDAFASAHNVKLEKWFKDVALWVLLFRHPLGGTVQIVIGAGRGGGTHLHSIWTVDDYERETRRLAWGVERNTSSESPQLEEALRDEIRRVLAWTDQDLTDESKMAKGTWHRHFSKEQFAALEEALPHPRV